jgi:hypothetical protein
VEECKIVEVRERMLALSSQTNKGDIMTRSLPTFPSLSWYCVGLWGHWQCHHTQVLLMADPSLHDKVNTDLSSTELVLGGVGGREVEEGKRDKVRERMLALLSQTNKVTS